MSGNTITEFLSL